MIIVLGGGLALLGAPVACAPSRPGVSAATRTTSPSQATAAPAQAREAATLVYGNTTALLNTDPYPNNHPSNQFRGQLFNSLVNLDAHGQPVPELAESWAFSQDRLTLTLNLRRGVKFHSGRIFTAEDAKWNLEYAQDPRSKAQAGSELAGVVITVLNDETLQLRLPGPLPHIFDLLLNVVIIDPQSNVAESAGGTGPFKLDSLRPDEEMRLVRHSDYWRADRPYLSAVTIKAIPDDSSLLVALESGSVDVGLPVPSNEVKRIQASSNITTAAYLGSGTHCFLVSAVDPPFDDRRVRQAVGFCIDRKRYVESVLFGLGEPDSTVFPSSSPIWDASLDTGTFDLDSARQLLADAGRSNGLEFKIQGSRSGVEGMFQLNQIVQSDLARIGVAAQIEEVEENQRVAMVTDGTFTGLLDHTYGNADLDPARLFSLFPFRPDKNSMRFQSDEYRRLVDAGRVEPDWNKRVAIYRDITKLLRDEAVILPVATPQAVFGLRANVHGLAVTPGQQSAPYFENVWLS